MRGGVSALAVLLVAASAAASPKDPAPRVETWGVHALHVRVALQAGLVRDLGLRLPATVKPDAEGRISFDLTAAGELAATAPDGVFATLADGVATLADGPTLAFAGGS